MSILAPLFDAFRRYRKTQGYILIDCLRRLPPGVLVRVIQDEDTNALRTQPAGPTAAGRPTVPNSPECLHRGSPSRAGRPPKQAFQPFDPLISGSTRNRTVST
jgi:hypothetical protein